MYDIEKGIQDMIASMCMIQKTLDAHIDIMQYAINFISSKGLTSEFTLYMFEQGKSKNQAGRQA